MRTSSKFIHGLLFLQTGVDFTQLPNTLEQYDSESNVYRIAASVCQVTKSIGRTENIEELEDLTEEDQRDLRIMQVVGGKVKEEACIWVSKIVYASYRLCSRSIP